MELDDLRSAWQQLDQKLDRQNQLAWEQLKDRRLARVRSALAPLRWGQTVQSLLGVLAILLGVSAWAGHRESAALLVAGIVVHAYGVLLIAVAGQTLWLISRLDYAAPVVAIQRQVADLRRFYMLGGMAIGLPWWVLWVPVMMTLVALSGVDMYARAPGLVHWGVAGGVAGLLLTWWFHRWSRRPNRAALGVRLEQTLTALSLRRTEALLEDLRRFEREEA